MSDILVGEGHNGGSIAGKRGDTLVISLPEPVTGFQWRAVQVDATRLRLQSDSPGPAPGGGVGGGMHVFRYILAEAGESTVVLQLARPWEANAPRSEFRLQVAIG